MQTGGDFLISEPEPSSILILEKLEPESTLMADAASQFMRGEVLPCADRLEMKEVDLLPSLLRKAAELGILATDVPLEYGGLGLSKSVSARISEAVAVEPSFAVSQGVHTSVATLPIVFFGTQEQKQRYLPKLATGELIGAYALSESHAGTDAMAMRCRAVPNADGTGFTLTGEKMWITNGAFAGLFTIFAKVEDEVCAFLVERGFPGVSTGREEHKLGLKASSTCRVILDKVEVPRTNLLGGIGDGGRIAILVLNIGRFKIAASSVGQSKNLLSIATRYAKERQAFGRPIAEFGMIREKIARMAERIYACESMLYRLAGCLDGAFAEASNDPAKYEIAAAEFAIECALVKVACTECLDYLADETLQIHGGYGYTEEFPAAKAWRDARVNRIYEGTSEINRINAVGLTMRRIESGRIKLPENLPKPEELKSIVPVPGMFDAPPFPSNLLRQCLHHVFQAAKSRVPKVLEIQGVAGALSDMMIALYTAESALVRHAALPPSAAERAHRLSGMARAEAFYRSHIQFRMASATVLAECGDPGWALWKKLEPLLEEVRAARVTLRTALARSVIESDGYPL